MDQLMKKLESGKMITGIASTERHFLELEMLAVLARRTDPARLLIIGAYRHVEMLGVPRQHKLDRKA